MKAGLYGIAETGTLLAGPDGHAGDNEFRVAEQLL
jgi:hypothetical protein